MEASNLQAASGPLVRLFFLWTISPLVSGIREDRGSLEGPDNANGCFYLGLKMNDVVCLMVWYAGKSFNRK
jgi:hypothetical protein